MIRSLKFKNFQSFLEETEVLFELPKGAPSRGYERRATDGTRLTTVLAAFGANASGKTAFLKPAAFLLWFMKGSFGLDVDEDIPLPPRILNPNEPSEFEIVFDSEGETWKYELKLTEKRVLWEALYKKATRFSYLFKREWNEQNDAYDVQLKSFDLPLHVARKARRNASLVSTARQHDSDSTEFIDGYMGQWNVDIDGRPHYLSNLKYANQAFLKLDGVRDQAISLLRSWDLGLDSFEVREEDSVDAAGKKKRNCAPTSSIRGKTGSTSRCPTRWSPTVPSPPTYFSRCCYPSCTLAALLSSTKWKVISIRICWSLCFHYSTRNRPILLELSCSLPVTQRRSWTTSARRRPIS